MRFILSQPVGCKLYTPLQAVVDYRGHRIVASSLLPVSGEKSLVYGSCDGGKTVHADLLPVNALMASAARMMNLKAHRVQNVLICAPADIEVHQGSDNRYYVLDTARVMPPERPSRFFQALFIPCGDGAIEAVDLRVASMQAQITELLGSSDPYTFHFSLGTIYVPKECTDKKKNIPNARAQYLLGREAQACVGDAVVVPHGFKGKFLFQLFRPEFVASYSKPLSSDAFTGFGSHNAGEHNNEVAEASTQLESVVIPRFARDIVNGGPIRDGTLLTQEMHRRGIPIRMIGLVWVNVSESERVLRSLLMTEMVARSLKTFFKNTLRQDGPDRVKEYLNHLLGFTSESVLFWNLIVQLQIRAKFSYGQVYKKGTNFR